MASWRMLNSRTKVLRMGRRPDWEFDREDIRKRVLAIYAQQPGLTYAAIAQRVGISEPTVSSLLRKAPTVYRVECQPSSKLTCRVTSQKA